MGPQAFTDKLMDRKILPVLPSPYISMPQQSEYESEKAHYTQKYENGYWSVDYNKQSEWDKKYPGGYHDWSRTRIVIPYDHYNSLVTRLNELIEVVNTLQRRV